MEEYVMDYLVKFYIFEVSLDKILDDSLEDLKKKTPIGFSKRICEKNQNKSIEGFLLEEIGKYS